MWPLYSLISWPVSMLLYCFRGPPRPAKKNDLLSDVNITDHSLSLPRYYRSTPNPSSFAYSDPQVKVEGTIVIGVVYTAWGNAYCVFESRSSVTTSSVGNTWLSLLD